MTKHNSGWQKEGYRHSLAAKGVRTVTPEQRAKLDAMYQKYPHGGELVQEGLEYATDAIERLGAKERILDPKAYESLSEVWPAGDYEVLYGKNIENYHRLLMHATDETEIEVKKDDFVSLGSIQADGKEAVYHKMQGEMWSPFGQASSLIRQSGTGHTSMMVGDMIKHGESYYLVAAEGFIKAKVV